MVLCLLLLVMEVPHSLRFEASSLRNSMCGGISASIHLYCYLDFCTDSIFQVTCCMVFIWYGVLLNAASREYGLQRMNHVFVYCYVHVLLLVSNELSECHTANSFNCITLMLRCFILRLRDNFLILTSFVE